MNKITTTPAPLGTDSNGNPYLARGSYRTPDGKAQIDWKLAQHREHKGALFSASGTYKGGGGQNLEEIAKAYPTGPSPAAASTWARRARWLRSPVHLRASTAAVRPTGTNTKTERIKIRPGSVDVCGIGPRTTAASKATPTSQDRSRLPPASRHRLVRSARCVTGISSPVQVSVRQWPAPITGGAAATAPAR